MICPECRRECPDDFVECEGCGALLVDLFGTGGDEEKPAAAAAAGGEVLATGVFERHATFGGRYEILELLGEGGMGRVYRARDVELDKIIALKTIRGEKGKDPAVVQRFKQELLLARQITHRNVVRIYDLGEADGIKFFTMELIEGESLKEVLHERGPLPVDEAVGLAGKILDALAEAHRQGVVHRDLKPQNIMIDGEGEPHIMDFGIARSADSSSLTATGAMLGTPDYMSPEQVRGESADAQSDLFSFGVIFYEMLTGALPYPADTPVARVMMRLAEKPRRPRALRPELPPYLEALVLKCLEVDRTLRYRTAEEILEDLERERVDRSLGRRLVRAALRRKGATAAAVLLAALVGAAALRERPRPVAARAEAADEPVTTLAVLPFTNAAGVEELDWMRMGLAEMLVTDLGQSRYVRPLPTERIVTILGELGVGGQTRFDEPLLAEIARRAGVDRLLVGQFVAAGDAIRLDLGLRDAKTGVRTPIKIEGAGKDVLALVDRITAEVKKSLDLSPAQLRGDVDRPVAEVATGSVAALRAYHEGLEQMRRGADQAALEPFERAVAADPGFAMAHAKKAEALLHAGRRDEAAAAVAVAKRLADERPLPLAERYQIHAIAALVEEDFETAAASYGELTKLYPRDPDLHLARARALEMAGRAPEALAAYERVVAIAPESSAALLGLGRMQVVTGRPEEAIRSLEKARATGQLGTDLEALGMLESILGVAYRETGAYDEAVDALTRSLDARRRSGDRRGEAMTLTNLAAVYELQGDLDGALEAERQALAVARTLGDRASESMALLNLGLTHWARGELAEALAAFRASLRIEMERGDAANLANRLDHIADVYRLQGLYDDALVYLAQAKTYLERSDDTAEKGNNALFSGRVHQILGHYDRAAEAFLAAIGDYRDFGHPVAIAEAHTALGDLYVDQGRYADARESFAEAAKALEGVRAAPNRPTLLTMTARLHIELGEGESAARLLDEARQEAHGHGARGAIAFWEARLATLRGDAKRARRLYAEALREAAAGHDALLSLRARLGLARLDASRGGRALKALEEVLDDAREANAVVVVAEGAAALAEAALEAGAWELARRAAEEAAATASRFEGRPLVYRAKTVLAGALEGIGDAAGAAAARAEAETLREELRAQGLTGESPTVAP